MNITKENIDELNLVLKLQFTEEDYADNVNGALKQHRAKANMPGFRPGMVPMGMIKKMYGSSILAEEINKLISSSLSKFIADEKLSILGEPLPSEKEQKPLDFDNDTEFEFSFDLGLAPKVEVTLSKEDEFTYYEIDVNDELINQVKESHTKQHGAFAEVETAEGDVNLRGDFAELDAEGNVLENGVKTEEALVATGVIKDEEISALFEGAVVDQTIVLDVKKAFTNESDLAALLQVDKDKLETIGSTFQYTVRKIEAFTEAEVNQELFDKVYGEGVVTSEEDYIAKIVEQVKANFAASSDYKLGLDLKDALIEKLGIEIPTAFLRRWLKAANQDNEKLTDDIFEKEFPSFEISTKWQLIRDAIFKANNLEITKEDMEKEARASVEAQFAQYGLPLGSLPPETMDNFVQETLKKEEEARRIGEMIFERKVVGVAKEQVTMNTQLTSREDFDALFAPNAEAQAAEVMEQLETESAE